MGRETGWMGWRAVNTKAGATQRRWHYSILVLFQHLIDILLVLLFLLLAVGLYFELPFSHTERYTSQIVPVYTTSPAGGNIVRNRHHDNNHTERKLPMADK
jgi:hypothetical protein